MMTNTMDVTVKDLLDLPTVFYNDVFVYLWLSYILFKNLLKKYVYTF